MDVAHFVKPTRLATGNANLVRPHLQWVRLSLECRPAFVGGRADDHRGGLDLQLD
jgi:hypothetical protein